EKQQPIPKQAIDDIERALALRPDHYRLCGAAAKFYAAAFQQTGDADHRARAASLLLDALRLGLDASEIPNSGALTDIADELRPTAEFNTALTEGSQAIRAALLGLVDSLSGTD